MEKATVPGALAEALQKRREIMVVTVSPRAGRTVPPRPCRRSGTSTETTNAAATTSRPM